MKSSLLALAAFSALLALVLRSPDKFLYDEVFFVKYVTLLHEYGATREFLISLPGAPGPLYAVLHYFLEPLTNLTPVRMRLVNSVLLAFIVFLIWRIQAPSGRPSYSRTMLAALTIPMSWVLSGLALTEIPAMLFATASVFMLLRGVGETDEEGVRWLPAILSGLFLGIAAWGRQPYLLLCGVPVLLAVQNQKYARPAAAYCCIVGACFAPLVIAWGGLVPPKFQAVVQGLAVKHMLLSLSYTGVCFLLLAPSFFRASWIYALMASVAGILVNTWLRIIEIFPLRALAERYLSESMLNVYGASCGGVFMAIGGVFTFLLIAALWRERKEPHKIVAYSGLLICAVSPLFVAGQYSTRYTAMSLPYLLLSARGWQSQDVLSSALACLGAVLGFISLQEYYSLNLL